MVLRPCVLLLALLGASSAQYGKVDFRTSCTPSVKDKFNTALSLLYSFEYPNALTAFDAIAATDPACCMAYFMSASSFTHPIWDFIQDDRLVKAAAYSQRATHCAASNPKITPRETAYIRSLAIYTNTTNPSVAEPAQRLAAYARALNESVFVPFRATDENAAILYGLSLLAVGYQSESEPADGWPHLREAGKIQQQVIARNPDSPGALHYTVHAYDQPAMARMAYSAAQALQNNSCAVPHAVHMPSHIYSDLGIWNQSVSSNIASVNLAYEQWNSSRRQDWYHGSYFLQFAMLQLAMDCDAAKFLEHFQATAFSSSYQEAATRVASHYFVETRSWKQAAEFDLKQFYGLDPLAWGQQYLIRFNFMITAARAVLNHSISEISAANDAVRAANATLLSDPSWNKHQMPYWRLSYAMDVMAAEAWTTFRGESFEAGLAAMAAVAAYQMRSWAPEAGHLWDANEQLAEMYLLRNQPGDTQLALDAYEAARSVYPNRYRSLAGAGKCAEVLGMSSKACLYYGELVGFTSVTWLPEVSIDGMSASSCPKYAADRRPELARALQYLQDHC